MPARPSERIAAKPFTQPTSTTAAGRSCSAAGRLIAPILPSRTVVTDDRHDLGTPALHVLCDTNGAVCSRFVPSRHVLGSDPKTWAEESTRLLVGFSHGKDRRHRSQRQGRTGSRPQSARLRAAVVLARSHR